MTSLKKIQEKINDNCLLVNYIYAGVDLDSIEGSVESKIVILCEADKQKYLEKINKRQKEFRSEITKRAEREGKWEYEVINDMCGSIFGKIGVKNQLYIFFIK